MAVTVLISVAVVTCGRPSRCSLVGRKCGESPRPSVEMLAKPLLSQPLLAAWNSVQPPVILGGAEH